MSEKDYYVFYSAPTGGWDFIFIVVINVLCIMFERSNDAQK